MRYINSALPRKLCKDVFHPANFAILARFMPGEGLPVLFATGNLQATLRVK